MSIETQVHDQFKIFVGKLAADRTIGPIAEQV